MKRLALKATLAAARQSAVVSPKRPLVGQGCLAAVPAPIPVPLAIPMSSSTTRGLARG